MNPMLNKLLSHYMAPAGDEGADAGGAGIADTDVTTLGDDDAYMALSEDERRHLRGDHASDDPSAETLAAVVAAGEREPGQGAAPANADPDETGGDKGSAGIPRARFNEVNDRRKALESEVEELRAQLAARNGVAAQEAVTPPVAQSLSLQEAEEQYAQLMLDGDTKAAAALRLQINTAIEEAALARFNRASASERTQTQTAATVEQLLGQFPWLESPEGAEALELIEASAAMKMQRGVPKAQAISEATLAIAPKFAPPHRVGQEGDSSGDIRTQRANERGAAHSMQQPPLAQAGMGNRATPVVVDTSKLSDEEYMALPESERKKARGD